MSGHYDQTMKNIVEQEQAELAALQQQIMDGEGGPAVFEEQPFTGEEGPISAEAADLPDIGTIVVYLARPGEGRAGKSEFPAIVMHHEPDRESVVLYVIYDVDDHVTRPAMREASDEIPYPAWRYRRDQELERFDPTRINIIRRDLNDTVEHLDEMKRALYGEWERPDKSILEILVEFETKLKDIAKRVTRMDGAK
jgi:hypothetical protein